MGDGRIRDYNIGFDIMPEKNNNRTTVKVNATISERAKEWLQENPWFNRSQALEYAIRKAMHECGP